MEIFIDESGSFVPAPAANSWCVVSAYVVPESQLVPVTRVIQETRLLYPHPSGEAKIDHLPEPAYFDLLSRLIPMGGTLYSVATDLGIQTHVGLKSHQAAQVGKIRSQVPRMKFDGGRRGLENLAIGIEKLPPQLYLQLQCQAILIAKVLRLATLYLVQREPAALGNFRWRVDAKDVRKTKYEAAFQNILPALLQSMSFREPTQKLVGADYSHMDRFRFEDGVPSYLKADYGLDIKSGDDVGKMVREDFEFVDSKISDGVQIADLLASGIAKLLRGKFSDSDTAAYLLGRLCVQEAHDRVPVELVTFERSGHLHVSGEVAQRLRLLEKNARAMIIRKKTRNSLVP